MAPILSNALVSEVAANTTTVPESVPDAAEAPPDAEVLPAAGALLDVLLDDDELHAVSATPSTAADATARVLMPRRGRRGRDARPTPLPLVPPADGTCSVMSPPCPGSPTVPT